MDIKQRKGLISILETVVGLVLWFTAMRLLGIESLVPGTAGGIAGSLIVVFGCFALANRLLAFFIPAQIRGDQPDLYTQAQADIAAERRLRK